MSRANLMPIIDFLREQGVAYEIDSGGKHYRVFVGGRLATVVSRSPKAYRGPSHTHVTLAALKRAIRGLQQ